MLIGGGTRQNYASLLLFLAGGVASGVAVYYTQIGGRWGLPTVLALLLGEAELLEERRGVRPLLLLDDVLSELDAGRRRILADRLRASGQALVTSASRSALPCEPAQTLEVAQSADGTSAVRAA